MGTKEEVRISPFDSLPRMSPHASSGSFADWIEAAECRVLLVNVRSLALPPYKWLRLRLVYHAFSFSTSLGLIQKKTSANIRRPSEATVMNKVLCDIFMSHPNNGGPNATPIKRRLLYNDVIMPRWSRSTEPVIIVFRQGSRRPLPIPLSESSPMKTYRFVLRKMANVRETVTKISPIFINQRINEPFCLILAPVVYEVMTMQSRGQLAQTLCELPRYCKAFLLISEINRREHRKG